MIETLQMRVPKKAYKLIRKEAFRRHWPMTEVLDEIIGDYFAKKSEERN